MADQITTNQMTQDEATDKIFKADRKISRWGYPFWLIGFLLFIASPFVWLWSDWSFAWKFCLSGMLWMWIVSSVATHVKERVIANVEKSQKGKKKTFQERLEEKMKERKGNA